MTRALVAAAIVVVTVLGTAAPAYAHATLEDTDPPANATVARPPRTVTLHFDEAVEASLGAIRVFDDQDRRVDAGATHHPGGDGTRVQATLPSLRQGSYVVTWRVISDDSHPVHGAFVFSVGRASTSSIAAQDLAARLLDTQGGSTIVGALYAIARLALVASIALLVGGLAFVLVVWPDGRASPRVHVVVWAAWVLCAAITLLGFGLEGAYAGGFGVSHIVRPAVWSDIAHTRFGHVSFLRLAALALAVPLIARVLPRRGPVAEHPLDPGWRLSALVLGAVISATPGLAGHASTGPLVPFALVADTVHVGAMAVWLGGLVVLVAVLLPGAPETTLRSAVPRYSALALGAVGAIVASGVFQAFRQVDRLGALLDTDYGRLLLVKVLVFLVLMVVAAASRDVVSRRWRVPLDVVARGGEPAGAPPGRGDLVGVGAGAGSAVRDGDRRALEPGSGVEEGRSGLGARELDPGRDEYPEGYVLKETTARRRLRRSVLVEVVIAVVILSVTSLLVNAPPARGQENAPFAQTLKTSRLLVDAVVTPARRGTNQVHLYAFTPSGGPADVVDITAQLSVPSRGIAPITVPLIRAGPGHYTSAGFAVPFAATWSLSVKALVTDVDEVTATARVPIR